MSPTPTPVGPVTRETIESVLAGDAAAISMLRAHLVQVVDDVLPRAMVAHGRGDQAETRRLCRAAAHLVRDAIEPVIQEMISEYAADITRRCLGAIDLFGTADVQ